MPFLELFDETLDINSTHNYGLSVQISRVGLAFSIIDDTRNKYILLRSFEADNNRFFNEDEIKEIIEKDDFLNKSYKKVNIIIPTSKFTIIPSPLYDPARKEDYFTLNHIKEENETVAVNKIPEPDAIIVFSVVSTLLELSEKFFPAIYPCHHIKPLLNQSGYYSKNEQGLYVHLHLEKDYFNIIIIEKKLLKFINTFNYRNISDILYYVLNIFKNMEISHDTPVYFSGHTEKYDDLYSGFDLYLKNIRFAEPSGNFSFSNIFNDIALHKYINLFSIINCE
jgi:hypothetical protein